MVKKNKGKGLWETVVDNAMKENQIVAERDQMLKQGLKIFPPRDPKHGLR